MCDEKRKVLMLWVLEGGSRSPYMVRFESSSHSFAFNIILLLEIFMCI